MFSLSILGISLFILSVTYGYSSFPPKLSIEDELRYIEQMSLGDKKARDKLIEHNLRLVAHIAKKYYSSGVDQEDLISIGTVGLIKGVSSFSTEKGSKLSTYISRCIENVILSQRLQRGYF